MRVNANALIFDGDRVLLTKFRDGDGVYYTIPGGKVEKGESAHAAAVRECYEEAGVKVTIGELAFVYEYAPASGDRERFGNKQKIGLVFTGRLDSPANELRMVHPDEDQIGADWVPFARLEAAITEGTDLLYPKVEREVLAIARGIAGRPGFISNQPGAFSTLAKTTPSPRA